MTDRDIQNYARIIHDLAEHFGSSTEFVLHDLQSSNPEHTIVAIENGHVSGRSVGDGPSRIVLDAMRSGEQEAEDRLSYLTRTDDGKLLKSTTICIRDSAGKAVGLLGVNTDITLTMAMEKHLHELHTLDSPGEEPLRITTSVSDLLDALISQSLELAGKPVSLLTREEKISAIRFLNDRGAFLITKSGPRICSVFGISKFTLYSYLDEIKEKKPPYPSN